MTITVKPAWLFVPGDRTDRYTKAAERSDVTIVDFEDAVAKDAKAQARQAFLDFQAGPDALDPARTVLRVNAADTDEFAADLAFLNTLGTDSGYSIMLPKVETAQDADALAGWTVYGLIETAKGAHNIHAIAQSAHLAGLMWGAEDLMASMGGGSSRTEDGDYRHVAKYVRSSVLLAAKANGKIAIDSVWTAIDDLDGLAAEALDAVNSGFDAKALIHPKHVQVVRDSYRPSEKAAAWAQGVLAEAAKNHAGAWTYEGKMIDEPLLQQARNIAARIQ